MTKINSTNIDNVKNTSNIKSVQNKNAEKTSDSTIDFKTNSSSSEDSLVDFNSQISATEQSIEMAYEEAIMKLEEEIQKLQNQKFQLSISMYKKESNDRSSIQSQIQTIDNTINSCYTKIEDYLTKISQLKTKMANIQSQVSNMFASSSSSSSPIALESLYSTDFSPNLSSSQQSELQSFKSNFEKNKARYEAVEKKTGVPKELIAALHWRESSGNFGTYLHNGDPLGKPTVHVPAGKFFTNWEDAAVDALKGGYGTVSKGNIQSYYDFAERYNGLGYRNKGVPSPYVWAGTSNYTSGKYVADGQYSASTVDKQLGVAIMLKAIMA